MTPVMIHHFPANKKHSEMKVLDIKGAPAKSPLYVAMPQWIAWPAAAVADREVVGSTSKSESFFFFWGDHANFVIPISVAKMFYESFGGHQHKTCSC